MKFLLIGAPASGKGTLGKMLAQELSLPIVSVGALLRAVPETSPVYEKIREPMDAGLLAPNEISAGILREELSKEKYSNGFILDGWMRDLDQKKFFDPGVDYAIFINVSSETSMKRAAGRTERREDDEDEVVKRRIALFHLDTLPVVGSYRESGNLIEVDGEPNPDKVFQEALTKLKEKGVL